MPHTDDGPAPRVSVRLLESGDVLVGECGALVGTVYGAPVMTPSALHVRILLAGADIVAEAQFSPTWEGGEAADSGGWRWPSVRVAKNGTA